MACVDASSVVHGATSMDGVREALAETLERIRTEFFDERNGDPDSIVAVVTRPPAPGADHGLLFVAADGPLGGCGEATMLAGRMLASGPGSTVVLDTTAGPILAADLGNGSMALRMQTPAEHSADHVVGVEGRRLRVRTLTVAGNTFAVVAADDVGLDIGGTLPVLLASRGDALLRAISTAVVGRTAETAPTMLLLTEPVVGGSTTSAVVWGNAILNRGPCGTGTCARLVVALEDGEIGAGNTLQHMSPFGYAFTARLDGASLGAGAGEGPHIVLQGQVGTQAG
nr:proline racemase family protein [Rhizohabitans arisaemae]